MALMLDAEGAVLGRLASQAAKALLAGQEVVIINAEKSIITGNPQFIKQRYLEKLRLGSPQHGPHFPRRADAIVRRAVRGMLPYKKAKGLAALRRLRVFQGAPAEAKGEIKSMRRKVRSRFITVGELSRTINA
ncbi:MAG: 50S ribosomal protein L13 [Candidatus Aenigmatarchaeota archaeon]